MWIVMNDSFISIVEDRNDESKVVVRARVREDLLNTFPDKLDHLIETSDSDYRFRMFLDRDYVSDRMMNKIQDIDYYNFKSSIPSTERWRYKAYEKIWAVMFDIQELLTPGDGRYNIYRKSIK